MRKLMRFAVLAIFALTAACQDGPKLSPIAPSDTGGFPESSTRDTEEVKKIWVTSPYIGVHATGEAMDAYRDALTALKRAGNLRGVRTEIYQGDLRNPVIKMMGVDLGLEILGLVNNGFLSDPNVERRIDEIFYAYPYIKYFQIGNEITTIGGGEMTAEQYAAVLNRIYYHVYRPGSPHANKILLTYSFLGSGERGPTELEIVGNLALKSMDHNNVIIAINAYTPNDINGGYLGALNGPLRRFRVWVTETGTTDPDLHISFVQHNYPLLWDYLRAERKYWFVAWGGDSGPDTGLSLLKNPGRYPNYWKSPLLKLLTGLN